MSKFNEYIALYIINDNFSAKQLKVFVHLFLFKINCDIIRKTSENFNKIILLILVKTFNNFAVLLFCGDLIIRT